MSDTYARTVNKICERQKLFDEEKFNILSVMHHQTDERRLHSRFISFLLNPNASHNKGNVFLNLFLKTIRLNDFETDSITVYPTEDEKKEKDDIDILIINKNSNREIIIENKLFAPDSNKLENGKVIPQLMNYFSKRNINNKGINLVYLTLGGKAPSHKDYFTEECILISYLDHIINWLKSCLEEDLTPELKYAITQYRNLVYRITNNYELALALKDTIKSDQLDNAYQYWTQTPNDKCPEKLILEQFKHIKWHAIHEFYTRLKDELEKSLNTPIEGLTENKITSKAHKNSRRGIQIHFIRNNKTFYISNDTKGFTMGIHNENSENEYEHFSFNKKNKIDFSDFSSRSTFNMIDHNKANEIIKSIVAEMKEYVNKNK